MFAKTVQQYVKNQDCNLNLPSSEFQHNPSKQSNLPNIYDIYKATKKDSGRRIFKKVFLEHIPATSDTIKFEIWYKSQIEKKKTQWFRKAIMTRAVWPT